MDSSYVEWLTEVDRIGGEFAWVRQPRHFPPRDVSVPRSPAQLNSDVLRSDAAKVVDFVGVSRFQSLKEYL